MPEGEAGGGEIERLLALDRAHLIHPMHTVQEQDDLILFSRSHGATLEDAQGRRYLDGLSCLWNVNVGHGRREIADAIFAQATAMAYVSDYSGFSHEPAIRLSERVLALSYPNLAAVYFTVSGSEANEAAIKFARYYWKARGRPEKVKVISLEHSYHGVTLATMSATGMLAYRRGFEPAVPNFCQIPGPYRFRWTGPAVEGADDEQFSLLAAGQLEEALRREGPETVAAFVAEPVQGGGGVIVPPAGYFNRVREICSRYKMLFIADEVITGFGRTGRWFGLEHWGVQPDLVTFGKGATSAYLPLGGVMVARTVWEVMEAESKHGRLMQSNTYSGHPTCCAAALRNLEILEREQLIERAADLGRRLRQGLETLLVLPRVGEVRGLGLMAAVELVGDRVARAPLGGAAMAKALLGEMRKRGLITRVLVEPERGPIIFLAPPFIVSADELERMVSIVGNAVQRVVNQ